MEVEFFFIVLSRVMRTVKGTISSEDILFYSTHRACRMCLLALQHELVFNTNQIPQPPDVSVANILATNSTGTTNSTTASEQGSSTTPSTAPSESRPVAPTTSTSVTTTSQATAGSSATSVSPSKASYQVSLLCYSLYSDFV